jgi:hypothetical protein
VRGERDDKPRLGGDGGDPPEVDPETLRLREEAEAARQHIIRQARREMLTQRLAEACERADAEVYPAVAAILTGDIDLSGIDPRIFAHPTALKALRAARSAQDILLRARMDAAAAQALDRLTHTMNDPAASERARGAAAKAILDSRAKMGAPVEDGLEAMRAEVAAQRRGDDVASMTDDEVERRLRDLTTSGNAGRGT